MGLPVPERRITPQRVGKAKTMQKIVTLQLDTICADAEGVASMLSQACVRPSGTYRVQGLCQAGGNAYAILHPVPSGTPGATYRFAELHDVTAADIAGLLHERWAAGHDAIGSINLSDGLVLFLFAEVPHEVP